MAQALTSTFSARVGYIKSGYSKKYPAEHEADILIHKAAKKAYYAEYFKLQKAVREMLLHKQNYEYILGIETDKNEKDDRTRNIEK